MRHPLGVARRFREELFTELGRIARIGEENQRAIRDLSASVDRLAKERRSEIATLRRLRRGLESLQRQAFLAPDHVPYPERLLLERFGILSQNEEDGIIQALLRACGRGPGRCIEIGCGTNGGNSGILVDELGFRGLMVDANDDNVTAVRHRFRPANVTAAQAWVNRESIDELLDEHGFGGEVDVLSIDIDGNDIWVWEALEAAQPRIAVIEFNSLFGPERSVAVPYRRDFVRREVEGTKGLYYGASLAALERMGKRKGMRLVGIDHRGVNAFFVRDGLADEIPACAPGRAWRLLDKYHRHVAEGLDVYKLVEELGLPLETVD